MSHPVLPEAVPAERVALDTPAGLVALYHAAPADAGLNMLPPVLLVHSVNAAASVAEVAPLFAHQRQTRAVAALDLPGYGHSERSDRLTPPA